MLVLTLITVGLACLLQLSSPVRLDQSTQQHVFQARLFPRTHICLVLLICNNDDSLKFRLLCWTSLIYLLGRLTRHSEEDPLVRSCWHWDTSSDLWHQSVDQQRRGIPRRQIKPCIVRQAVLTKPCSRSESQTGGFKWHQRCKNNSLNIKYLLVSNRFLDVSLQRWQIKRHPDLKMYVLKPVKIDLLMFALGLKINPADILLLCNKCMNLNMLVFGRSQPNSPSRAPPTEELFFYVQCNITKMMAHAEQT